jgi:hypothetical protein
MNNRENMALGMYAVLYAALMMFCLVGAFVLPPGLVFSKWIGCVALAGFFVGIPLMLRAADRSRIRDAVQKMGGQPVRLKRILEFRDLWCARVLGSKFEVVYVDLAGSTHRAFCRTGFIQGVRWVEDSVVSTDHLES